MRVLREPTRPKKVDINRLTDETFPPMNEAEMAESGCKRPDKDKSKRVTHGATYKADIAF